MLWLTVFLVAVSAQYDFTVQLGWNITLSWAIRNNIVYGQTQLDGTLSWIGFGLSDVESAFGEWGMGQGDFIIGTFTPTCYVSDTNDPTPYEQQPLNDTIYGGTDDIIDYNCSRVGNTSIVQWSRKVDTGDAYDWAFDLQNPQHVVYAHGTTDVFSYHGSTRGMGVINWTTGQYTYTPGGVERKFPETDRKPGTLDRTGLFHGPPNRSHDTNVRPLRPNHKGRPLPGKKPNYPYRPGPDGELPAP
jgi:hypothetical protein